MSTSSRPDEHTVTLSVPPPPPPGPGSEQHAGRGEGAFQAPSSPVELASHRFPGALFGYRKQDVDAHLAHLAKEWEGLLLPSRTAMATLGVAVERAEGSRPYESLGEEVGRILSEANAAADAARRTGAEQYEAAAQAAEQQLSQAAAQSEHMLTDAAAQREQILAEAGAQREQILAEAAVQREQILQGALQERDDLAASSAELRARLSGIVAGVGPLLAAAPDLPAPVGRQEASDAVTTVEVLPEVAPLPEPAPEGEPESDGLRFLETAMGNEPRGAQRRSRR